MNEEKKAEMPMTMTPRMAQDGQAESIGRSSGRAVLLEQAARLEREAAGLRRLAGVLPGEMPNEADEALWNLATRRF